MNTLTVFSVTALQQVSVAQAKADMGDSIFAGWTEGNPLTLQSFRDNYDRKTREAEQRARDRSPAGMLDHPALAASDREDKRICFTCFGNTCRSPMAEYYWRFLEYKAGLIDNINSPESRATSRGVWWEHEKRKPKENEAISKHTPTVLTNWLLTLAEKYGAEQYGEGSAIWQQTLEYVDQFIPKILYADPIEKDANFVLITSSMNQAKLEEAGYDGHVVTGVFKGMPDPWHGAFELYEAAFNGAWQRIGNRYKSGVRQHGNKLWKMVYPDRQALPKGNEDPAFWGEIYEESAQSSSS